MLMAVAPAHAVDDVAGSLFTLTDSTTAPNGAWSWYEDERAIIDNSDPANPRLLVSSVSAGSAPESGDIDLMWRNLTTGAQGEFELHNQLQQDDHNSASLHVRPDGRYLAMYAEHGSDQFTRWRISTNPHDPTSWGTEQTLDNGAGTTYNNTYYLADDNNGAGRTYNFTRTVNYDPNVQVSDDHGTTWTNAGKLLTEGGGGDRPYLRYASDGKKIHFIATNRHPRNYQNSIYHGYVQDGVLYNSNGTPIDADLFDSNGVAPSELTTVFQNGSEFNGVDMYRAWTINMEIDNTGNPVGIFTTRVNDSNQDHRFFYARFDGQDWQVNEMAKAGAFLYSAESDYTGLASIDPNNPNVVYMSSTVDPRDGSNTDKYELYKGLTSDFGESWSWSAITENSTIDNIRPVVPEWNGQNTAVTWMRGNYNTYADWDTEIVGLNFAATDPKSLLWRGDAGDPNAWDQGVSANWDSGGGTMDVFNNGDEVAFDDSASDYQVHLAESLSPKGVAFNNSSASYTVTGAGIAGAGNLRVIGGGTVTFDGGNHAYTGETRIIRGQLALSGAAQLSGTSSIHVGEQGTLDTTAVEGGAYVLDGQTLTVKGILNGSVVATNNSLVEVHPSTSFQGDLTTASSTITGAGTISGTVVAQAGTTIQVGQGGLTVMPGGGSVSVIDDFEGYTVGNAHSGGSDAFELNAGPWTTNNDGGSGLAAIVENESNQHLAFGWGAGQRGASRTATTIANGESGTYYFRVRTNDASPDVSYGLSDVPSGDAFSFGEYEVQIALVNNGGPTLGARDGGVFQQLVTGLSADTWYDIWLVVDNETDTYDAYYGTGGDPNGIGSATKFADDFGFRNGTASNDLVTFMTLSNNHEDLNAFVDDVSYSSLPPGPTVITGAATLVVDGDYEQHASALLSLDIATSEAHDRLVVSGTASLAGTLQVVLADSSPTLVSGDTFDLLDFETASGDFDTYELPLLDAGLRWDVSNVSLDGTIAVALRLEGDFNGDGTVNLADYTVWRNSLGAMEDAAVLAGNGTQDSLVDIDDYLLWKSNFGASISELGTAKQIAAVPEPASLQLLAILVVTLLKRL